MNRLRAWPRNRNMRHFRVELDSQQQKWWGSESWQVCRNYDNGAEFQWMNLELCLEIAEFLKECPRIASLIIEPGLDQDAQLDTMMRILFGIPNISKAICFAACKHHRCRLKPRWKEFFWGHCRGHNCGAGIPIPEEDFHRWKSAFGSDIVLHGPPEIWSANEHKSNAILHGV